MAAAIGGAVPNHFTKSPVTFASKMVTTENSLGLRALRLPTSAGRRAPVKIQLFAVAMGISATSQSSTCENWGFFGSSEFRAFPMAVLVSSSNGCAIRRAFSPGDKGPCN
jgi:hypothetical protein